MAMAKIKKGDAVVMITGKNKGQSGIVNKVVIKKDRKNNQKVLAVVSGINVATLHKKPDPRNNKPGEIVKLEKPVDISNLALFIDGQRVKVGFKVDESGKKIRINKKTGDKIAGDK
jgi:large subunit ribosomal protein L24